MASINGIEINLTPTQGMKTKAKRFIQWKEEGKKGGTETARNRLSVDNSTRFNMDKKLYFETTTLSQIDKENGEIFGVSVISTPEAKGHNLKIDQASIQSFFDAVEGKQVKAYNTHSNNEGVGDVIGIWENFRIEEGQEFTKLLADFSALDSWRKNKEEEYESFFELAEKAPETFGVSAEFIGYGVQYNEEGEEFEWNGEDEGDVFARAKEVHAFSIVTEPASNPTGLFSENTITQDPVNNEEVLHLLEIASSELTASNDENRELQLELKLKTDLCTLLESENTKSQELIEQLEEELEIEKKTLKVLREKFDILRESGTAPVEGVVHEEEQKSVSEKIFSSSSWIEKQKLFSENISELSKNWRKLRQ